MHATVIYKVEEKLGNNVAKNIEPVGVYVLAKLAKEMYKCKYVARYLLVRHLYS